MRNAIFVYLSKLLVIISMLICLVNCGEVSGPNDEISPSTIDPPSATNCGNNQTEPGEACDDGNLANGDGCDSQCAIESAPVMNPNAGPSPNMDNVERDNNNDAHEADDNQTKSPDDVGNGNGTSEPNNIAPLQRGESPLSPSPLQPPSAICNYSTNAPCSSDGDCVINNCSSGICQGKNEQPFEGCYDCDMASDVFPEESCGCYNRTCQWFYDQHRDSDNDCYPDEIEKLAGSDWWDGNSKPLDNDRDCLPDITDPDDDNDGVLDIMDAFPFDPNEWADNDRDGIGDNADMDDDNDCYPDVIETGEVCRSLEYVRDPVDCYRYCEAYNRSDPLDPSSTPSDNDKDCRVDAFYFDTDDDNDCYDDALEIVAGTDSFDPLSFPPDSDSDCIPDNQICVQKTAEMGCYDDSDWYESCYGEFLDGNDRDKDGVPDAMDAFPFDPNEWADNDRDGIGDNADMDDDSDGMPDMWENRYGLNPLSYADADTDKDGDGFTNIEEFMEGTDPTDKDSFPQ